MAIPFILGGITLAAAGTGAKKGYDAMCKNNDAREIVKKTQLKFEVAEEKLKNEGEILNEKLEDFAEFKLLVFTTQIKNLVETLRQCKDSVNSSLNLENLNITSEEIKLLENTVSNSLEITSGIGKGIISGGLTSLGAYGSVGALASASTGTAISSLGGVAATNATLAWLGGGSLAAGGGGMALGTAVLGGVAAGPLIAIAGLVMDTKAEKNLTEAKSFEAETEIKINKMELSVEGLKITSKRIDELKHVIDELAARFDAIFANINKVSIVDKIKRFFGFAKICKMEEIDQLISVGKNLKIVLDISLLDKNGNNNINFNKEIKRIKI